MANFTYRFEKKKEEKTFFDYSHLKRFIIIIQKLLMFVCGAVIVFTQYWFFMLLAFLIIFINIEIIDENDNFKIKIIWGW